MTLLATPFLERLRPNARRGVGLDRLDKVEFRLRPGSGMQHTRKRTSRGAGEARGERLHRVAQTDAAVTLQARHRVIEIE